MSDKCEIQLDKPYYHPGDTVNGFVICYFTSEIKIRDIRVMFKGRAKVHWKVGKSTYDNEEDYFELESNLLSSRTTFQPGNYSYPFVFNLPVDLPSSVEQQNGSIKYQVKATVDKPFARDYTAKKNFYVYSYTNLNHNPPLKNPAVFSEDKTFAFHSSDKFIKVVVKLPKTGYIPGEMIFYTCTVKNNSTVKVKDVRFNFVQGYKLIALRDTRIIYGLEGQPYAITNGTVLPNTEQTWDLQMRVPDDVYNGNIDHCKIINVFWELRGEVRLPLMHSNLYIAIPITIGSVAFQTMTSGQGEK